MNFGRGNIVIEVHIFIHLIIPLLFLISLFTTRSTTRFVRSSVGPSVTLYFLGSGPEGDEVLLNTGGLSFVRPSVRPFVRSFVSPPLHQTPQA